MMSINQLPTEILYRVFTYLSPADRLDASLVCLKWFEILLHPQFVSNYCVQIKNCALFLDKPPVSVLSNCVRNYTALTLKGALLLHRPELQEFWARLGESVTEVTIRDCHQQAGNRFKTILEHFPLLRTLRLYDCCELPCVADVVELDIAECIVSESELEACVSGMTRLKKLRISWDTIAEILTVARNEIQETTIRFLRRTAERVDNLKLSILLPVPFYDDRILTVLSELSSLQIVEFVFRSRDDISVDVFRRFLEAQCHIEKLELRNSRALKPDILQLFNEYLIDLKELVLQSGSPYFETPLEIIEGLGGIRKFSVLTHYSGGPQNKTVLIKRVSKKNLLELRLPKINTQICNESLLKTLKSFPHLRILDLSSCFIDDAGIAIIFKLCNYLRELYLDDCIEISDTGLTGNRNQGVSLTNLTSLRILSLGNCPRITDLSLIAAFRFRDLIKLNLAGNPNITDIGIDAVVMNCRALQELDVSRCAKFNDRCLTLICENLHRLRRLEIPNSEGGEASSIALEAQALP